MITDEAIVDPRATVDFAFVASAALKPSSDLFYSLNARVHLQAIKQKRAQRAVRSRLASATIRYASARRRWRRRSA